MYPSIIQPDLGLAYGPWVAIYCTARFRTTLYVPWVAIYCTSRSGISLYVLWVAIYCTARSGTGFYVPWVAIYCTARSGTSLWSVDTAKSSAPIMEEYSQEGWAELLTTP